MLILFVLILYIVSRVRAPGFPREHERTCDMWHAAAKLHGRRKETEMEATNQTELTMAIGQQRKTQQQQQQDQSNNYNKG